MKYYFQVWFQNRRAKFRRNERNVLATRGGGSNTMYAPTQSSLDQQVLEQPVIPPRPTVNDYGMPWPAASPYGANTNYPGSQNYNHTASIDGVSASVSQSRMGSGVPSSAACVMTSTPYSTPSVGNSIANLRLKAREYASHQPPQQPYPMTHHPMA